MTAERREVTRFPIFVPVILRFPNGGEIRGDTKDVSASGVFVFSALQRPVGQTCEVHFPPRTGIHTGIQLPGQIVRCDELGMGVRFATVPPEMRTRLQALFASHQRRR